MSTTNFAIRLLPNTVTAAETACAVTPVAAVETLLDKLGDSAEYLAFSGVWFEGLHSDVVTCA